MRMTDHTRCRWCNLKNPLYVDYHDNEWCVPQHDDKVLFELLLLESFQAGLSWETVLNKREHFRSAFDSFDPHVIRAYCEEKIAALMTDPGIIRHRKKIDSAITNAAVFLEIQQQWGSFDRYIWHFTDGKTVYETGATRSRLSDTVSKDLQKRGMRFVGTTIIYSYLQAIGVLYSHDRECFLYKENSSG